MVQPTRVSGADDPEAELPAEADVADVEEQREEVETPEAEESYPHGPEPSAADLG